MWDNHSSASYWLVSNVNQPNEVKSFTAAHSVHNSDQCNDVTMVSAWSRALPRHCDTTLGCDQFVQAPVSSCWLTHTHTHTTHLSTTTPHTHHVLPPIKLSTVGSRAFPVAAAQVWNGLPEAVISSSSLQLFRHQLKTHLFQLSYLRLILWLLIRHRYSGPCSNIVI